MKKIISSFKKIKLSTLKKAFKIRSVEDLEKFIGSAFSEIGNTSMMRILCLFSLSIAGGLSFYMVYLDRVSIDGVALVGGFILAAFTGKHYSKKVEMRLKKEDIGGSDGSEDKQ
jgi:hypothetical protein